MGKLPCKPRRQGDQLACHVCGKAWDLDEPYPEECLPARPAAAELSKLIKWAPPAGDNRGQKR